MFNFSGYKMICGDCERRFIISEENYQKFLHDDEYIITCPDCGSEVINLVEIEGELLGY